MIVRGESTITDYHAPFDQGLRECTSRCNTVENIHIHKVIGPLDHFRNIKIQLDSEA